MKQMNNLVPIVHRADWYRAKGPYDIYSRLLKDRVVFIDGEINDITADLLVAQIAIS